MISLPELETYCTELLSAEQFKDYCPNGLQVDAGRHEISRIVSGVTASMALIDQAAEQQADLMLVHHGWFWRNEPAPLTGVKGRRVRELLRHGINLMAYHLPLDAHPKLGNNRRLGDKLGFMDHAPLEEGGLVWGGSMTPLSADEFAAHLEQTLQRPPLHLPGGPTTISRVAWCTGAAQGEIETAASLGFDAFISGEVSESSTHLAHELGIHYFSAGHHATERYGVQALGEHLAEKFGLQHRYIEVENPV